MFNTKEELEAKYPIGYIYKTEYVAQQLYCGSDVIFEKMQDYYGKDNVVMISPHHAEYRHYVPYTVEGYIFDNKAWYPAERFHNEWKIIPEELLEGSR